MSAAEKQPFQDIADELAMREPKAWVVENVGGFDRSEEVGPLGIKPETPFEKFCKLVNVKTSSNYFIKKHVECGGRFSPTTRSRIYIVGVHTNHGGQSL